MFPGELGLQTSLAQMTNFHEDEAKKKFLKKKLKVADSKKTEFFKITNSQYVFVKISWICPWVCRIE